jgi:hypothetical protein
LRTPVQQYLPQQDKQRTGLLVQAPSWLTMVKVKFSPLQALEALRVVRGWGSHIF